MKSQQNLLCEIKKTTGATTWTTSTDGYWYRVQPMGRSLRHRTTTSNGELVDGVHVHATLEQAVLQDGADEMRAEGFELVAIHGPVRIPDSGDAEGWLLPRGKGRIVARCDFAALCAEYEREVARCDE